MKYIYLPAFVFLLCTVPVRAQQWRVVEDIYQEYNKTSESYVTQDSTRYAYDPYFSKGSTRNNDTIYYTQRKKYKVAGGNLSLREDFKQQFYPDGQIQINTRQALDTITNKWELLGVDSFYRTANRLDLMVTNRLLHTGTGYAMYPTNRIVYNYDVNANLTAAMSQNSYAFSYVWTNQIMYRYGYDNGKIIADSFFSAGIGNAWVLDYVSSYVYDPNGLLMYKYRLTRNTTGGLDTFSRIRYVNNQQNRIDTATADFYNAGQWTTLSHTVFTYHSNGDIATDLRITPGSSQPFASAYRYTYNQYGYLAESEYEAYNGPKTRHVYTYVHYWPASVGSMQQEIDLQIAPIPTSDIINIKAKFATGTKLQAAITNMHGRVVMQWEDELKNDTYHKQIPVGQLLPGNYFISFNTGAAKVTRQLVIVK